jgi:hypothetical protein
VPAGTEYFAAKTAAERLWEIMARSRGLGKDSLSGLAEISALVIAQIGNSPQSKSKTANRLVPKDEVSGRGFLATYRVVH